MDQIQLTVSNRTQINTWRKSRRQLAYSTVGTPDYIAPEIFSGQGYDFGCDWWSVGTIMFECLIGWPPFCAEEPHDTYRKIVDWPRNLHFPPDQQLGAEAEDFVRRLVFLAPFRLRIANIFFLASFAMLTIVSAASVVPARSGNTRFSAASRGMACDASAHRSSPSSSPTLIHSTSPSMRLTRTTTAPPTEHKPRSQETTNTPPACLSSVTRTSVSMLSEVRRVLVDWLRRHTPQLHILFAGFGIAYTHRPGVGPFFSLGLHLKLSCCASCWYYEVY